MKPIGSLSLLQHYMGGVEPRTASFWVGPPTVTGAHGFCP
eukprot:COSAG01_NODE_74086_length_228_cov_75.372093_1_plen_39_part_10